MAFQSINPFTGELFASFDQISENHLLEILNNSHSSYNDWKRTDISHRIRVISNIAESLEVNKSRYSLLMTAEMGKPIKQAEAEILKCASLCRYYAEHATEFLSPKTYATKYSESKVVFDPLGIIYAIMPWNFPFWQVFRCAIPAILAGNVVVLKHAENVPQCALAIEELFNTVEKGILTNLFIDHDQSNEVIAHKNVKGVSLTGSERAGSTVASQAGKFIKPTVLELGGSDPFIVLNDADLETTVNAAVESRMQNTGQSCICAKRFIVQDKIYSDFIELFKQKVSELKIGNPEHEQTNIGPLARKDLVENLERQVKESVSAGAKILTSGDAIEGNGFFYPPVILINIPKNCPAYSEELFGPVASVFKVSTVEEAISIANDTQFGLGASIWSKDLKKAQKIALEINSGSVYINTIVKSDPAIPFGGVNHSGYGRELSDFGILEFVNIKTICIA